MAEYEFRVMQKSLRKGPTSRNKVCCELTCQGFFGGIFCKAHTMSNLGWISCYTVMTKD